MNYSLKVYRDRETRTFGIYVQPGMDGTGQSLLEGGFFRRYAAERALSEDWAQRELKCGCGGPHNHKGHCDNWMSEVK